MTRHSTAEAVRRIAQVTGLSVMEHKTLLAAASLIEVQDRLLKQKATGGEPRGKATSEHPSAEDGGA